MWERLIKIRPNLIVIASRFYVDVRLFKIALDNGYIINERDLQRNKSFCYNDFVMTEAIKVNPNFIKYWLGNLKSIILEAIKLGYKINIDDLEKNNNLACDETISYLIENGHPEVIKFFNEVSYLMVNRAIELGYKPKVEDLEKNQKLGEFSNIIKILMEEDVNVIKYYKSDSWGFYHEDEEIIEYALKNGYSPSIDDVKNNNALAHSDEIFKMLITSDPTIIVYYLGKNQEVFNLALALGYKPSLEDLKNHYTLGNSDEIMKILIKIDVDTIFKYLGNNDEIYELAYKLNVDEEKIIEYIKDNYRSNFSESKFVMKKLIERDSSFIEYYNGRDLEVFNLAFEKGYIPTEDFCDKHKYHDEVEKLIIRVKPEFYVFFKDELGSTENIVLAVQYGYIPTEEEMDNKKAVANELVPLLIDKKPEYVKYYDGDDKEIYINGIKHNYLPSMEIVRSKWFLCTDPDVMIPIVMINPEYLEYCSENIYLCVRIMATDYIPSIEEVKNDYLVCNDYRVMMKLISINPEFINCCIKNFLYQKEQAIKLLECAVHNGYSIDTLMMDESMLSIIYESDELMNLLIKTKDINYIKKYRGLDIDVFKSVIGKYNPSVVYFDLYSIQGENDAIINLIISGNLDIIKENESIISSKYLRLFKIAIDMGYVPSINNISVSNSRFINEELLKTVIDNSTMEECIELFYRIQLSDELKKYIIDSKNIIIPSEYFNLLTNYKNDRTIFVSNYYRFASFLKEIQVDEDTFVQYTFFNNYDWLSYILSIVNDGKIEEFKKIKKYFFDNYYFKGNNDFNDANKIKALNNIIKNYVRYPELCLDIVNNNVKINGEVLERLDFLFEISESFDGEDKPNSIEQLLEIDDIFHKRYLTEIEGIDLKNIDEVKDIICRRLFDNDLYQIGLLLKIYGDTEELRQLLFDNRDNEDLYDIINEMMIYTSMMESIIEAKDIDYLIEMAKKIADNYKLSSKCMMLFSRFDDKMKELYSEELSSNLTALRDDVSLDSLIDKDMSKECGVEVLDFSDRQYCILAHVLSSSENIEQIVLGQSVGSQNFISFSAASHRNQVYYGYNSRRIIFGYDSLPTGAFVQSSTENFGTNGLIDEYSTEVKDGEYRKQRGALKTSSAPSGYNSEILCFRGGVKPKYIILPGGRKPTEQEISIAKEYNLKFVKTQEVYNSVENPRKIDDNLLVVKRKQSDGAEVDSIRNLNKAIIPASSNRRRIAIFTDSHALFEPTLAILEDARKSGITEIYSLGDNIGTGPNPREVMELLDEYGVESLSGNHEIYAALGVDELREHLDSSGGYEEAKRNSSWTRARLTKEQLEKIRNNPESKIIEIGGQRVLLTHYSRDYNTNYKLQVPDGVSQIFQGHVHFEGEDDGVTTLRGAGIGNKADEKNKAYYIVLVERPEGGFDIERHVIEYDYESLMYDIKESDMYDEDKDKIGKWAGVSR